MEAMVDRGKRLKFLDESKRLVDEESRAIREFVEKETEYIQRHPRTRGKMVADEVSNWWWNSARPAEDAAYAVARSIDEPNFDFAGAFKMADDIIEGVWTPGKPQATKQATGLLNIYGEEIVEQGVKQEKVMLGPTEDAIAPLRELAERIKKIDETLPYETLEGEAVTHTRADRIRELIKTADDLALPTPGQRRTEVQGKAAALSRELREMFENPVNESPVFTAAWRKATAIGRKNRETREHLAVVDVVRTDTPSQIVDNLIVNRRASIDNLIAIRKATNKETFEEIRSEFVRSMFDAERRKPGALAMGLENMDENVLRMLMPQKTRRVMKWAARQYQALESTGIRQALKRQAELRPFIREVLDNKNTAGIDALHTLAKRQPGGLNSPFGQSVRHAILDELIERSTITGRAGGRSALEGYAPVAEHFARTAGSFDRISGKLLNDTLDDFRDRGLLRFLRKSDLQTAGDVELIQKLMDIAAEDAGTALLGAATVKGVTQFSMDAIADMIHFFGLSRLFTNGVATRLLAGPALGGTGGAREATDPRLIQLVGAMFVSLKDSTSDDSDIPEYNALLGKPQEAPK
jgi:hypothetical protein